MASSIRPSVLEAEIWPKRKYANQSNGISTWKTECYSKLKRTGAKKKCYHHTSIYFTHVAVYGSRTVNDATY